MGTAKASVIKAKFKDGQKDYRLGAHPIWELFRTAYQMTRKPILVGGLALFCGYAWNMCRQVERSVTDELLRFRRADQMGRLKKSLKGGLAL